jgi:hypothetical protein
MLENAAKSAVGPGTSSEKALGTFLSETNLETDLS